MMPADEQANVCHFGRHLVYNLNDDALTVQEKQAKLVSAFTQMFEQDIALVDTLTNIKGLVAQTIVIMQDASTQLQHTAKLESSAANVPASPVPVPPLPSAPPRPAVYFLSTKNIRNLEM
jgi:hypothetical protein